MRSKREGRDSQGSKRARGGCRGGNELVETNDGKLEVNEHRGADDVQLPVMLPGFIDLHGRGADGVDLRITLPQVREEEARARITDITRGQAVIRAVED